MARRTNDEDARASARSAGEARIHQFGEDARGEAEKRRATTGRRLRLELQKPDGCAFEGLLGDRPRRRTPAQQGGGQRGIVEDPRQLSVQKLRRDIEVDDGQRFEALVGVPAAGPHQGDGCPPDGRRPRRRAVERLPLKHEGDFDEVVRVLGDVARDLDARGAHFLVGRDEDVATAVQVH